MIPPNDQKNVEEPPPVFGNWRRIYWAVALFFVVEVVLFFGFTLYYS